MKTNNLRLEDVEIGNETDAEMSVLAVFALGKRHSPQEDRTFCRCKPHCDCNPICKSYSTCSCHTKKEKEGCYCVNNKCDDYATPCRRDDTCPHDSHSCCPDYR